MKGIAEPEYKLVTCKEAADLLREGKITKAEFRPTELFVPLGHYSDSDPAYIWVD